ncbi:MAG: DUF465 domain-containing protein [Deltaproteobacteria bacterium]|nr:DUF465 domain-containing protein [Deltaproteobacteria bacterium]
MKTQSRDQVVIKKLLDEDAGFRKTYDEHKDYEAKLKKLDKKAHLNATEIVEKNRLKKLKLALKDEMHKRLSGTSHKG